MLAGCRVDPDWRLILEGDQLLWIGMAHSRSIFANSAYMENAAAIFVNSDEREGVSAVNPATTATPSNALSSTYSIAAAPASSVTNTDISFFMLVCSQRVERAYCN